MSGRYSSGRQVTPVIRFKMFTRYRSAIAILIGLLCWPAHAQQPAPPQRFALLIANSEYPKAIGTLENPRHDIGIIQSALKRIGFPEANIIADFDVDGAKLLVHVQNHVSRVKAAGPGTISFFYYSGHGMAAPANTPGAAGNYIIPHGVEFPNQPDFWSKAVGLEQINALLRTAPTAKHIIIFDACRTELTLPVKDVEKGYDPPLLSQEVEMLTAFATAPRRTAFDEFTKGDFNGPYAIALAENLIKPGQDHLHLFSNVRTRVSNLTQSRQIPWTHDGLLTPLTLVPVDSVAPPTDDHVDCNNIQQVNAVPEDPIVWHEVFEKTGIQFKTHAYTYEAPRANAKLIDEVNRGATHRVAPGTRIWAGTMKGELAWYRYERNVGIDGSLYVVASEVEVF